MSPTPIADAEYAGRIDRLRAGLSEAGLAGLIAYGAHRDYQPADLRYLARWYCVEEEQAALFIPASGPTTLLTDASWDLERAQAEAFADEMRHSRDLGSALAALIAGAGAATGTIGIAGFHVFPVPAYLALRERLPDARLVDASDLTATLRIVKSPAELDLMRAASRISDDAMRTGLAVIEEGATETAVAAAAEAVIRAAGAEPSFVTEMGSGPRTALGTFLPGSRTLAAGELAVLDCGARVHGYHGDMCRTVVVGGPAPEQLRKLEAVERAVGEAIAAVRPGVTVGAIRDVAAGSIAESGYGDRWWDAFMPHGNGAGQHEPPNAKDHPDMALREGMVLCIEPGITVPGEGAVIIEQMIAVTADGAEVLNALPTNMWDAA
ncbi:MAG TPA: Xaa-Pro peptidase family protein [Gaiellales bacterium]|jgi:Xaa-Pro aminopeptidase|nr:Xaa-Pro peptidase family protein [Gaiellales bacterium]